MKRIKERVVLNIEITFMKKKRTQKNQVRNSAAIGYFAINGELWELVIHPFFRSAKVSVFLKLI